MGRVRRLESKLYNTPHLVVPEFAEFVFEYLANRDATKASLDQESIETKAKEKRVVAGISIIPVEGPLTYKSTGWEAICGGMSYEALLKMVSEAISSGAKTIVLDVDSPGGEAYQLFETANEMKKRCEEAGVKLVAYVDGISASAAYGLSCVADELIVNPGAEVGSIGVVTRLTNSNKKNKQAGIETTYVYAGANKIPFGPDGEFREDFISDIQQKVDALYGEFVTHVAGARSLSEDAVRGTEAKMYRAEDAINLGLADKAMTKEEFYDYVLPVARSGKGEKMALATENLREREEMSIEEEKAKLEAAHNAEMERVKAELEAERAKMAMSLEEAKKALDALMAEKASAQKAEIEKVVAGYSFLEDDTKSQLSNFLFENKDSAGYGLILSVLESANKSVEKFATEEHGVSGEGEPAASVDASLGNAVKEILRARSKK